MTALLELRSVAAGYDGARVLHDVSVEIAAGRVTALLGANGAGKSTLLRSVIGLVRIERGDVLLEGQSLLALGVAARVGRGIGYAPEGRRVFPGLTVRENLTVAGAGDRSRRTARLAEMESLFPDLASRAEVRAWQLSGGQQQMLAVARALMLEPKLLLLDEPSLGLAPGLVADLFAQLRSIADRGVAILVAEQTLPPALAVADTVIGLKQGRVVLSGTAVDLRGDMSWVQSLL